MMSSLFLPSTLAFISLLIFTTAQARTLASDCSILKAAILARDGRSLSPPASSLQSNQLISYDYKKQNLPSPPPSPKPAPPIGELGFISSPCSDAATPCNYNKHISMVTDSGRRIRSPPKPSASALNQITALEGSAPSHVSASA